MTPADVAALLGRHGIAGDAATDIADAFDRLRAERDAARTLARPGSLALPSWSFVVEGEPKTKRGADKGRFGNMHSDRGTDQYEMRVAGAALDAGLAAGRGPCAVDISVYLSSARRKDADRITSAVFDGLKKGGRRALVDDNLMVIQDERIRLGGIEPDRPRVEIAVQMLDPLVCVPWPAEVKAAEVVARRAARARR